MDPLQRQSTISIIDDDASVRSAVSRLLRLHGFLTEAFASAEDFLQSDKLSNSSCVVADIRMPGMTGVELLEYLTRQNRHIPVILITAFPEPGNEVRAMRSGAICFLAKPFDERNFIDCIEAALKDPDSGPAGDGSD
jgi:FixJ family two-component response regulator